MGTACVMVVDDKPDTRRTVGAALAQNGYKVVLASGGADALSIVKNPDHPDRPDLILLDIGMPVDGKFVIDNLPPGGWKVVLMTGACKDELPGAEHYGGTIKRILHKPFAMTELLEVVADVLGLPKPVAPPRAPGGPATIEIP